MFQRSPKFFSLVVLAVLVVAGQRSLVAGDPVAIVTINSLDDMMGDFSYLADAVGAGQMGQTVSMMAGAYTRGLDTARPISLVAMSDGQTITPLGMLPVKNLAEFLAGVKNQLGEPQDAGNGIQELSGPMPVFVKESNGWAFVAQATEHLAELPADPMSLLQGLNQQYDIAIRGLIQNIPQHFRQMALSQMKAGIEMQLNNLPAEGSEADLQRTLMENSIQQWEAIFNEVNELTIGWRVDRDTKETFLDLSVTAIPGTKTARQMALLKDASSKFSGFLLKDAAINMNTVTRMVDEDIQQALAMLSPVRQRAKEEIANDEDLADDAAKQAAQRLLDELFDVLEDTVKGGEIDGGASVLVADNSLTAVLALTVADGNKFKEALKGLADMAKDDPEFPGIKFNAAEHKGVSFHTMSIPLPADQEEARQVFGETVKVAIGTAPESIFIGIGNDCLDYLRQGIDDSATGTPAMMPFQMTVAMGPLMQFAVQLDESGNEMLAAVAETLKNVEDDHIKVTSASIENGARYRVEIEEGVFKSVGEAQQGAVAAGGG